MKYYFVIQNISLVTVSLGIKLRIDFLGLSFPLIFIRESPLQLLLGLDVGPHTHSREEVGVDLLLLGSVDLMLQSPSLCLLMRLRLPHPASLTRKHFNGE